MIKDIFPLPDAVLYFDYNDIKRRFAFTLVNKEV